MAHWVLGLTGGIGSGKSAISRMFEHLGITVVDADIIARDVVALGSPALSQIAAHFGEQVLQDDGTLKRSKLRALIFADEQQKTWLNNLLHPLIRKNILQQLEQASSGYVILVAPLLFENKLHHYCHRTLLVDVPVEIQLQRTCQRDGVSTSQAQAIINAQMPREQKQQLADDILDNTPPLNEVEVQVKALHLHYLTLATQHQ